MSALLGKAGKKLFEGHLEQYAPPDPLYEFYVDDRGKKQRRKRIVPPGLSSRDAKILKSVQRRAHYLDKGFRILCFRFGWTFVIGLIPVVGDIADLSLNYLLVVRKARQADIPSWLLRRMLLNNIISAGVGFVPFIGDVILAIYKANSRNAALLEEFLRIRGDEFLKIQEQEQASQAGGSRQAGVVSTKDAEQVKPGAGLVRGEVVPTEPTSPSEIQEKDTPKKTSGNGRKAFGFFGSSKSGGSDGKAPPSGDKGRFVEDVEPTVTSSSKTG